MACGGKENLNREKLKPLISRERDVELYPDRDAAEQWQQIAAQIGYSRMKVNNSYIDKWWQPEDGEKADIADIIIRILTNNKHP